MSWLGSLYSVLSQAPPQTGDWSGLLYGVLGGSPAAFVLAWTYHLEHARTTKLETELREREDRMLSLAERAFPALVEATKTLSDVKAAMDATTRGAPADLTRLLSRLEDLTQEIRQQKGGQ